MLCCYSCSIYGKYFLLFSRIECKYFTIELCYIDNKPLVQWTDLQSTANWLGMAIWDKSQTICIENLGLFGQDDPFKLADLKILSRSTDKPSSPDPRYPGPSSQELVSAQNEPSQLMMMLCRLLHWLYTTIRHIHERVLQPFTTGSCAQMKVSSLHWKQKVSQSYLHLPGSHLAKLVKSAK